MGRRKRTRGRRIVTRLEEVPAGWRALASYPKEVQKYLSEAELPSVRVCSTDSHTRTGPVYLEPEAAEAVLSRRQAPTPGGLPPNDAVVMSRLQTMSERIDQLHTKFDRMLQLGCTNH